MTDQTTKHEGIDGFYTAEHTEMLIVRAAGEAWLAWETEDGDWFAIRPRSEDDAEGSEEDRWRPIGPEPIESLNFPITVAPALAAWEPSDCSREYSDAAWREFSDRQGGA